MGEENNDVKAGGEDISHGCGNIFNDISMALTGHSTGIMDSVAEFALGEPDVNGCFSRAHDGVEAAAPPTAEPAPVIESAPDVSFKPEQ